MNKTMPQLISVKKIWDKSEHNALADLIFYKEHFFCSLRESNEHFGGRNGVIRILMSKDAKNWKPVALLSLRGVDLRDPMLSVMPDGRLMLSMGGSRYNKRKCQGCHPCVAFTSNGCDWTQIHVIDLPNEWIWRVTWHEDIGYGISYRTNPIKVQAPWKATLFKTYNGFDYIPLCKIDVKKNPSEGTIRFTKNGTAIALLRRQGPGYIGLSKPPYKKWTWTNIGFRLGGPNFVILPNGEMWAGSRLLAEEKMRRTVLAKLSTKTYDPMLILPSDGDTSYPGLVYRNGLLYMCYYSTHEKKTNVYLAIINI